MRELPSILQRIIGRKKLRLEQAKACKPLSELKAMIKDLPPPKNFSAAVSVRDRINIIAEIKRASPSRGVIRNNFDIAEILRAYEQGEVTACSILTEQDFFRGCLEDLRSLRRLTDKPILRKDFMFDPYQVYEAREAGADAVLLIAAALDQDDLKSLIALSTSLNFSALVEVHTLAELFRSLDAGADMIGINNRNLNTFEIDLDKSVRLNYFIPVDKIVISESGIKGPDDIRYLLNAGISTFLIGEYFMERDNIAAAVTELKGCYE
jgi:indole-3-glycerol phosphate synthase